MSMILPPILRSQLFPWTDGKYRMEAEPDGGGSSGNWTPGQPPVPATLSGAWSEGATMTLTGSNFSAEATETFFTDFSGDTLGQFPSGFIDWGTHPAKYAVVEDGAPPIGTRSARVSAINQQMATITHDFSAPQTEMVLELWLRVNKQSFVSETQPGEEQVKLCRIANGSGTDSMQNPPTEIGITYSKDNGVSAYYKQDVTGIPAYYAKNAAGQDWVPTDSEWAKMVLYFKYGSLGQADGQVLAKYGAAPYFKHSSQTNPQHMASPSGTVDRFGYDSELLITHTAGNDGELPRRFSLPYFHRDDQETIIDVSRVHASNSRERVLVGDAATWSACDKTKVYTLETIDRAETQIQFTAANSTLIPGQKWIYTVNHDGLINSNGVAA